MAIFLILVLVVVLVLYYSLNGASDSPEMPRSSSATSSEASGDEGRDNTGGGLEDSAEGTPEDSLTLYPISVIASGVPDDSDLGAFERVNEVFTLDSIIDGLQLLATSSNDEPSDTESTQLVLLSVNPHGLESSITLQGSMVAADRLKSRAEYGNPLFSKLGIKSISLSGRQEVLSVQSVDRGGQWSVEVCPLGRRHSDSTPGCTMCATEFGFSGPNCSIYSPQAVSDDPNLASDAISLHSPGPRQCTPQLGDLTTKCVRGQSTFDLTLSALDDSVRCIRRSDNLFTTAPFSVQLPAIIESSALSMARFEHTDGDASVILPAPFVSFYTNDDCSAGGFLEHLWCHDEFDCQTCPEAACPNNHVCESSLMGDGTCACPAGHFGENCEVCECDLGTCNEHSIW